MALASCMARMPCDEEVKDLKRDHPEQMHTIISELEALLGFGACWGL